MTSRIEKRAKTKKEIIDICPNGIDIRELEINGALICAMDNGKNDCKFKFGESKAYERKRGNKFLRGLTRVLKGKDTFNVEYEGIQYTIGSNATKFDWEEGKASDFHIMSTLCEIARVLPPSSEGIVHKIKMVYSESCGVFFDKNTDNVATIIEKLKKQHTVIVDGITYTFIIEDIEVLPEGLGHIYLDLDKYAGEQYVIDIGGATINFLRVVDGMPDPDMCTSFMLGLNNVLNQAIPLLKGADKGILTTEGVKEILTGKNTDQESFDIVQQCIKDQLMELDDALMPLNIDIKKLIKTQKFTFTGGCAEPFKEQILNHYSTPIPAEELIVAEGDMTNVRGSYEYAMMLWGEE